MRKKAQIKLGIVLISFIFLIGVFVISAGEQTSPQLLLKKAQGLEQYLIDDYNWTTDSSNVYITIDININRWNWAKDAVDNPTMAKCLQAEPIIQDDYPNFDCTNSVHRDLLLTKLNNIVSKGLRVKSKINDLGYINRSGDLVTITVPRNQLQSVDEIEIGEDSLTFYYLDNSVDLDPNDPDFIKKLLQNDDYQDYLRTTGYSHINDGAYFKTYDYANKRLVVQDNNNTLILNISLDSEYSTQRTSGINIPVAEMILHNWSDSQSFLLDAVRSYSIGNGSYDSINKSYLLMYETPYQAEHCVDIGELEPFCYNYTESNWTQFQTLDELPNKEIKIAITTNTTYGESIEWVPTIAGIDLIEWADYDITAGATSIFDPAGNTYNKFKRVNKTLYIGTYLGGSGLPTAILIAVNLTDNSVYNVSEPFAFYGTASNFITLEKATNDTTFVSAFAGSGTDGFIRTLVVDLSTLTISSPTELEYNTVRGQWPSISRGNGTLFVVSHSGQANDGFATVVGLNPSTLALTELSPAKYEFDTLSASHIDSKPLNLTDHVIVYTNSLSDGSAFILTINLTDFTLSEGGNKLTYDTTGTYNQVQILNNKSTIAVSYASGGLGGRLQLLTINSTHDLNEIYLHNGSAWSYQSLLNIDNSTLALTSSGTGSDGFVDIFRYYSNNLTVYNVSRLEFNTTFAEYNSLVEINNTLLFNAFSSPTGVGSAVVLSMEYNFPPMITVHTPTNNTESNDVEQDLNVTITDDTGLDDCLWNKGDGTGNHTFTCTTNITDEVWYNWTNGSQNPLTASQTGAGAFWGNVDNMKADAGGTSGVSVNAESSRELRATNFSWGIPTGSTINGIVAYLDRDGGSSINGCLDDNEIKLVKSGAQVGNDEAKGTPGVTCLWTATAETIVYGNSTYLWGTTWTAEELNNETSGFGVSVSEGDGEDESPFVDHMYMSVWYTLPNGTALTITIYANDTAGNENHTSLNFSIVSSGGGPDVTPPVLSVYNVTVDNETSILADFNATDNIAVDKYWTNDTGEAKFQINENNGLVENTTNLSIRVHWLNVSVNDTSGNIDSKLVKFNITAVTPIDSCTYSGSGTWNILCSDNCTLDTTTNVQNNILNITGSGIVNITSASIFNVSALHKYSTSTQCPFIVYPTLGGDFRLKG